VMVMGWLSSGIFMGGLPREKVRYSERARRPPSFNPKIGRPEPPGKALLVKRRPA